MDETTKIDPFPNAESEKNLENSGVEYDSGLEIPTENKNMIFQRRSVRENDTIYDLTDVMEGKQEKNIPDDLDNELMEKVSHITERVARELFPDIAERIIREEIEKLKQEMDE